MDDAQGDPQWLAALHNHPQRPPWPPPVSTLKGRSGWSLLPRARGSFGGCWLGPGPVPAKRGEWDGSMGGDSARTGCRMESAPL